MMLSISAVIPNIASLRSKPSQMESNVSVADFYAGKCVFITGATGFLGQVLTEKLLYSCPEVETIYILIREKKNLNIQQRFEKILASEIFDRIRKRRKEDLNKIIPIIGEITAQNLGIKQEDEKIILEKVSIVIHSAATVRFNEPLKTAFDINLDGTIKVLELCRRIKNIEILIHVSTAYSNTESQFVEEKIYPPLVPIEEARSYINENGDNEELMNNYLFGKPNTYTFTKALAEFALKEMHGAVPVVIIKPSIVTASKSEPLEGWVDNWNGATGVLSAIGAGFSRVLYSEKSHILDIVPVDYVSNFILAVGAKCHGTKDVTVFNYCSSFVNPVTMGLSANQFCVRFTEYGINEVPFPACYMTRRRWIANIVILLLEIIPSYFIDFCLYILQKPTRFIKIQSQISQVRKTLAYFTKHSWVMKNEKTMEVINSLSAKDFKTFPCNPKDINWNDYLQVYTRGVGKYLMAKKSRGKV